VAHLDFFRSFEVFTKGTAYILLLFYAISIVAFFLSCVALIRTRQINKDIRALFLSHQRMLSAEERRRLKELREDRISGDDFDRATDTRPF
jgi:hypothetical protein